MMRKIIPFLSLILLFAIACEDETNVNYNDDITEEKNDTIISGTKWVAPFTNFDDQFCPGMAVYDDKLFLSTSGYTGSMFYYHSTYTSGDKFTIKEFNLTASGSGFNKFLILDNQLYATGSGGTNGAFKWDDNYEEWENAAGIYTNGYSFALYNGDKIVSCGFSPFVRTSSSYWGELGTNGPNGAVYDLQVYNGELYAAGSFSSCGSVTTNNIAKWDGNSWQAVGDGLDKKVWDLEVYNGKLLAAGSFDKSGTVDCEGIAVLNGNNWEAFGGGLVTGYNGVRKIYPYGSMLFVGGDFQKSADGVNSPYIIKWDGSAWEALPSGVPASISGIAVYKNDLYISNAHQSFGNNFILKLE